MPIKSLPLRRLRRLRRHRRHLRRHLRRRRRRRLLHRLLLHRQRGANEPHSYVRLSLH